MPKLQAEGRFLARILAHGVSETKEKHCPQWVARFAVFQQEGLTEERDAAGRQVVGFFNLDQPYEIPGFFTLAYTKDGKQEFSYIVENLITALKWTPNPARPWASLQEMNLDDITVQIVVERETYEGKERLTVKYVNPADFDGMDVRKLDAAALTSLDTTWGAAFRAKFGGGKPAAPAAPRGPAPRPTTAAAPAPRPTTAPSPAPAPAPSRPPAPRAPTTPPPPSQPVEPPPAPIAGQPYAGGEATMDQAWDAFKLGQGNMTDDGLAGEWFRIVSASFGDQTAIEAVTAAQWAWMRDYGAGLIIPF